MIGRLLESNKTLMNDECELNASYYSKIAASPTPKAVWIGRCWFESERRHHNGITSGYYVLCTGILQISSRLMMLELQ